MCTLWTWIPLAIELAVPGQGQYLQEYKFFTPPLLCFPFLFKSNVFAYLLRWNAGFFLFPGIDQPRLTSRTTAPYQRKTCQNNYFLIQITSRLIFVTKSSPNEPVTLICARKKLLFSGSRRRSQAFGILCYHRAIDFSVLYVHNRAWSERWQLLSQ